MAKSNAICTRALTLLVALILLSLQAGVVNSVIFRLDPNGQQCISEDAGSEEVLVYVQYNVTSRPDASVKVSLEVTSTEDEAKGQKSEKIVQETDIFEGKVTFISDASEEFRICFRSTSPSVCRLLRRHVPAATTFFCRLIIVTLRWIFVRQRVRRCG